jgi:hypothetical protein
MTQKFKAVLVKPLDQQRDADSYLIDPNGVEFDPETLYPIFPEFRHDELPLGHATAYLEDGTLMISGEFFEPLLPKTEDPWKAAIACISSKGENWPVKGSTTIVKSCRLVEIGITPRHQDPDQPPIEFSGED